MERTNSTRMTTFKRNGPAAAIFVFSEPTSTIRITIPEGSEFRVGMHWHFTSLDISRLSWVSGEAIIATMGNRDEDRSFSGSGAGGFSRTFTVDQVVSWGTMRLKARGTTIVDIGVSDTTLQRNICSAILDRDIFFQLASTPLWAKAIFAVLALIPGMRERLLGMVLTMQLRAIYYAHDYHIYEGQIPFNAPFGWPFTPPVPKARELEFRSHFWVSKIVMGSSYWIGRIFLGMKGEYEQYTPSRSLENGSWVRDVGSF